MAPKIFGQPLPPPTTKTGKPKKPSKVFKPTGLPPKPKGASFGNYAAKALTAAKEGNVAGFNEVYLNFQMEKSKLNAKAPSTVKYMESLKENLMMQHQNWISQIEQTAAKET